VALLLLAAPAAAQAQTQAGGVFAISSYTTAIHQAGSVALADNGDFVVVWTEWGGRDPSLDGVMARRFAADGVAQPEFLVNAYTTGVQTAPKAALRANGDFVIVWSSEGQDGDRDGIVARHDVAGVSNEFVVNTYTTSFQSGPQLALAPDGAFTVAWSGSGPAAGSMWMRAFDAFTAVPGPERPSGAGIRPSIGTDRAGRVVAVWELPNRQGVMGRRFDRQGDPIGDEFSIAGPTFPSDARPIVSVNSRGRFVVAWHAPGQAPFSNDLFARVFDADGVAASPVILIPQEVSDNDVSPALALDDTGIFLVSWGRVTVFEPRPLGIYARYFGEDGSPLTSQFQIAGPEATAPVAGSDRSGNMVLAWDTDTALHGWRVGAGVATALEVDPLPSGSSDGNGVLEPVLRLDRGTGATRRGGRVRTRHVLSE
jgi:hypothetical protein